MGDLADRVTTKNKGMVSELPLTISAQDGLISQDEFFNKKVASKDLSSYLLLHHGDFAYNKSYSNGYPFGTIKRLEKYPQGVVSSLYIAFKPNSSISSDFMAQYYESNNWHKEIYKCAAEGARNHGLLNVPPSDFFATNLNIPITKSEQLKIGRLLNAVDQTITLHEEKKRQLERLKSALLQKMFADENGYPAVRFRGFDEAWKQCKLGDVFVERNQKTVADKNYPLCSFIAHKGVVPKAKYDRSFLVKSDDKKYKRTELNDFIYSSNNLETGSIGLNKFGNATISPVYSVFMVKGNSEFIAGLATTHRFIYEMIRFRQGVVYGQWRINESDFLKIKYYIPQVLEQEEIGNLLSELDRTITLHDQKLNLLKLVKQSLLQNMFI
ncbi:restriction endonuclease subunit S [Lactobacillus delbrueckii subsp. bulgaricus]